MILSQLRSTGLAKVIVSPWGEGFLLGFQLEEIFGLPDPQRPDEAVNDEILGTMEHRRSSFEDVLALHHCRISWVHRHSYLSGVLPPEALSRSLPRILFEVMDDQKYNHGSDASGNC